MDFDFNSGHAAAEPLPVILAHLHRQATCQDKGSKPGGA